MDTQASKYCRKVPLQCSHCGSVFYTCTCVQLHVQFAHALWLYEVMCELCVCVCVLRCLCWYFSYMSMISSHSVAKECTAQPGISLQFWQFHNKLRKKGIVRHEMLSLKSVESSGLGLIRWLGFPKCTLQLDLSWNNETLRNTAYVRHWSNTAESTASKASLFQTDFFPPPPCLWTRSTFTNEVRKAC